MEDKLLEVVYTFFLNSTGVSIDTRSIKPGEIFFAIKGDNFDGNDYALSALEKGASKAVVSRDSLTGQNIICVDDTLLFLQRLASYHRTESKMNILALTGSNGKTTTKELIAQVLKEQYRIDFTKGNLNNHLGVPLSLLRFRKDLEIGIVEMGANHVGEIASLSEIASPDFGLITNIGKAHIGEFGGQENILIAKTELYRNIMKNSGVIFCNQNDPVLPAQLEDYEHVVYFDNRFQGDVNLVSKTCEPFIDIELKNNGGRYSAKLNIGGRHNLMNVKVAVAVGLYFGLTPKAILKQLEDFQAPDNRSQWKATRRNKVYLDAYNANPDSVSAAIAYFTRLDESNKLIIIGDMRELGEFSAKEHQVIYELLVKNEVPFYLIGSEFYSAVKDPRVFRTKKEFQDQIDLNKIVDTTILIKASRGIELESLLSEL